MKQSHLIFTLFSLLFLSLNATVTTSLSPASSPVLSPPKAPATMKPSTPPPAESPTAAMVPVSKGPLNIIKILQKAGHFSHFIRLIKTTQEDIQFASQLNASQDGITIFAPTDGAFSAIIKTGTLNALSDQEKIQLVQFHAIPRLLSTPQFQTVSNPLKTLAGSGKQFQLNVTTSDSMVNVTSGLTNTTVSGIVYMDDQLAIYQVDKVLLPKEVFSPKSLAPAPAPAKPPRISPILFSNHSRPGVTRCSSSGATGPHQRGQNTKESGSLQGIRPSPENNTARQQP
ncbi:Fasciclin-like arabinogalactan protein 11 [Linum perenne]